MTKSRKRLAFVALAGILGCIAYLWLTLPTDHIDKSSFDKIAVGMTLQEVESLLRCPPGNYSSSSAMVECNRPDGSVGGIAVDEIVREANVGAGAFIWASDRGMIVVILDAQGKVEDKQFGAMYAEGLLMKARRWLASIL